jgi:hypothetical protein
MVEGDSPEEVGDRNTEADRDGVKSLLRQIAVPIV